MLKFNCISFCGVWNHTSYLNTSYVKVQFMRGIDVSHNNGDLNTSYVKVQCFCILGKIRWIHI